ncbi:hypothetical protein J3456_16365 [Sulfitobacter sp. NFXS29]
MFLGLAITLVGVWFTSRGSFPTEDAATKLIYLAIRNFERGGRNVREWFAARMRNAQLAIISP